MLACIFVHVYMHTVFLPSDATSTVVFFAVRFGAATIRGRRLFFWKGRRRQRWLDKVHTSDTVTTIGQLLVVSAASQSCCQPWKQVIYHKQP